MANAEVEEGGTVFPRFRKFLPPLHRRVLASRKATVRTHEEGSEVELGRGRTRGIRRD